MLASADSAGAITVSWLTNGNKLHNFKNRNQHVVLYEVKQKFAPGVDALTEKVGIPDDAAMIDGHVKRSGFLGMKDDAKVRLN